MDFSIHPKIPRDYSPKADSSDTIRKWNNDNKEVSRYLTSYQIVVPVFVFTFSIVAISFFLFANSQSYHDNVKEFIDSKTAAGWELRTNMYILMAVSCTISGYIFGIDMAAIGFRNQHEIVREFEWFNDDYDSLSPLDLLYHLTTGLSAVDGMVFGLCLVTLIVMGIHNMVCILLERRGGSCCGCGLLDTALPWYFLVFPSVSVAAHADQITIGFIHDPYHATAVGISYGIILVTCVALLRFIAHLVHASLTDVGGIGYVRGLGCSRRWEYIFILTLFTIVLILVILSFMYFIALYFLLPISGAIDDAPNRILTIYQSIVVIFAAYLTYWVVIKKPSSPLDFIIKAKDKLQARIDEPQHDVEWMNNTYEMKELTLVKYLLKILEKDDTSHDTSSSPVTTHATSDATLSSPVTTDTTSPDVTTAVATAVITSQETETLINN